MSSTFCQNVIILLVMDDIGTRRPLRQHAMCISSLSSFFSYVAERPTFRHVNYCYFNPLCKLLFPHPPVYVIWPSSEIMFYRVRSPPFVLIPLIWRSVTFCQQPLVIACGFTCSVKLLASNNVMPHVFGKLFFECGLRCRRVG